LNESPTTHEIESSISPRPSHKSSAKVRHPNPAYGLHQEHRVYVYDPYVADFRFLAYFPQENSILLGEQFLQADTLLFKIQQIPAFPKSDDSENEIAALDELEPPFEEGYEAAGA
jgi:hypothetical protein